MIPIDGLVVLGLPGGFLGVINYFNLQFCGRYSIFLMLGRVLESYKENQALVTNEG